MHFKLVIGLSLMWHTCGQDIPMCPFGWFMHNNKCYGFADSAATRDDSKQECESRQATLATVNSSDINTFLQQHINSSYWIGLRVNNLAELTWKWSDGERLNDIDWCEDVGTSSSTCGVVFIASYLADPCLKRYTCTIPRYFVCEKGKKASTCEAGWDEVYVKHTNNSHCYYASTETKTWMDASRFCMENGARLISVSHTGALYFVKYRHLAHTMYWVGLSPYTWEDESLYTWHNWDLNGPSGIAKCTLLKPDGKWSQGMCDNDPYKFICQRNAVLTSTITSSAEETKQTTIQTGVSDTTIETNTEIQTSETKRSTYTFRAETTSTVKSTSGDITVKAEHIKNQEDANDLQNSIAFLGTVGAMPAVIVCIVIAFVSYIIHTKRQKIRSRVPPIPRHVSVDDQYYNDDGNHHGKRHLQSSATDTTHVPEINSYQRLESDAPCTSIPQDTDSYLEPLGNNENENPGMKNVDAFVQPDIADQESVQDDGSYVELDHNSDDKHGSKDNGAANRRDKNDNVEVYVQKCVGNVHLVGTESPYDNAVFKVGNTSYVEMY